MKSFLYVFIFCCAALSLGRAGDTNIASQKPVIASGPVTGAASLVTDGDSSTSTAPTAAGSIGFYYQIDLGAEFPIQAIYLYSKVNDGANKLSKVRMAVYSDNGGAPGVERWGYEIRADGSNNVQGSVDIITGNLNPTGNFRGRYVRLTNVGNTLTAPQIGEIEVFEAPKPTVKYFGPDAGNITKTGAPGKPTQAVLSWNVAGYTALSIDQGIGSITGPTGSVTVSPNVTTTYTLTASNGAGQVILPVTIGVDEAELPPFISEFLASNVGGIKDQNGNRSDWIEFANPNAFALNLKDYYLTDNAANLVKWKFPDFTVPGNGFAIVWASNTTSPAPGLDVPHTNFSLATEGEYLGLIGKDGVSVISQIPVNYPASLVYPQQRQDRSYGIAAGTPGYFVPTPGAPNGTRFDGVVRDTVFSVKRGIYTAQQSVAITSATLDAEIRYTLDGSTPTATTGTVYTGPVAVSTTLVLKAAAFKPTWVPTNTDTQTYVFPADVRATAAAKGFLQAATIANMTDTEVETALKEVPSMSLTVGPGVTIDGGEDKLATLEWLDPAGGPTFQIPCGAQLFGGAFTNFAKKSYRISFKGDYGAGKLKFPLFAGFDRGFAAVDEFDQLEVRNGSHDMSQRGFYMSNAFTDATMLDMGSLGAHSRFVHFYINGVYWGVHQLRERWSADMMSAYYGGQSTDYESVNGNLNVGGWADPGLPYDGTGAQWEQVKALARSGGNVYDKLRPYVDVPQYIDYMIMWMFGRSEDEYRVSGPLGFGHGFKFILNDADGYLPYAPYGVNVLNRTTRTTPGKANGDGPGSLFSMLFRDGGADYRALLADRIQRSYVTSGGAMTPAANAARLTELCNTITNSMRLEAARWNYITWSGATPPAAASWQAYRDACVAAFANRTTDVLATYTGAGFYPATTPPVFNLPPGVVASGSNLQISTTTSGGILYYTTDGSDPRVPIAAPLNTPYVTAATAGKYRVPTGPNDGVVAPDIANLAAHFPLNINAQDTINGYLGSANNGVAFVTPGRLGGGAASFDGSNDNIQIGNPTGLRITGNITLAAWVKPTSITGLRTIISKGTDAVTAPNGETFLRINAGAYEGGFTINGGTSVLVSGPATGTGSAFSDVGRYAHLALVYDGAAWILYRNGAVLNSVASANGTPAAAAGWAIGSRGPGDARYFYGQIDDVRIYNRGLTLAEISSLAAGTASVPGVTWNLLGFNDGSWSDATGAIGFAPPGDTLLPGIVKNLGGEMSGVNASVYQRFTFNVTAGEKAALQALELRVKSDDGYAVYLNGVRIAGRNSAAFLSGNATATAATADATALAGDVVNLAPFISTLVVGPNVLAIQGLNVSAADDDFLLGVELYGNQGPQGLALAAQTYSSALPLTSSTLVKARTYNPTTKEWSGLQETFYQVGAAACPVGALAVSELHYNPSGDDDGEFIELMNVSNGAINLRGVKFGAGVTFQFPTNRDTALAPGQRLVLVDSELTFQRIQGWSASLGGIYLGSFDNGGERVWILAADGTTTLVDFTYDGKSPWPNAADGNGHSLILINPQVGIDHNNPANWRVSQGLNGNPNAGDAIPFTGNPTADADGDGLNGRMEFALGTSDSLANPVPMAMINDPLAGFSVTLEHANGTDSANPQPVASEELTLWTVPLKLTKRQLLPNGHLLSTWQANPVGPQPDRLFFRFDLP